MPTTSHLIAQAPACAWGASAPRTMLEMSAKVRSRPGFMGEKARENTPSAQGNGGVQAARRAFPVPARPLLSSVLILIAALFPAWGHLVGGAGGFDLADGSRSP